MTEDATPGWAPKVHPLAREAAPEDPLELHAEALPGDPRVMLECLLQEFAWLGFGRAQLLALFHNPGYPVLHQLRAHLGDAEIERCVDELAARWGRLRFRETVAEPDPADEDDGPELLQLRMFDGE